MKAKLVKRSNDRFDLYSIEDKNQINTIASSFDNPIGKLSLKNCQAIELGYDLDELISESDTSHLALFTSDSHELMYDEGFKAGFKKALEILGDKKFSADEIIKAYNEGWSLNYDYFQSLQQTEWDVEIVNFTEDDLKSISEDWGKLGKPKLDTDGCLILKTFKSE